MTSWSRVELFQFGPLASKAESAGKDMYEGLGIRDFIYAWPTTSRCRVEEQLITQNYASRGMSGVLISGRGLFALEYLLYYSGSDTECAATSSTATQWAQLDNDELSERKRNYAVALASDNVEQIARARELWDADGANFMTTFVNAGGMYPDEQEVMKVLAWALIYVEREVKDWKLGIPAGYTLSHPVTLPEAPYSGVGSDNIRANLEGFRSLFQGCGVEGEGIGFDDWLTAIDHAELATEMVAAMNGALAAAAEFPPFGQATPEQLEALYQKIRALTSLLKSDFFGAGSPLSLELPGGVQSDTD
jgi:predicted lipoprotein